MRARYLFCVGILSCTAASAAHSGGQNDFDFEFGTWKTHVSRLAHPLSGSKEWVDLDGTSVVRPIMDGRANIVELDVAGPSGHIAGISLRLYNPETRQWSLNYASFRNGVLTVTLPKDEKAQSQVKRIAIKH